MIDRDSDNWQEDDSEIECARCGEHFYFELNSCPNCGRAVYEPEPDEQDGEIWGVDPDRDTLEEWVARIAPAAAIFTGLFTSFLIAGGIFVGLRFLFMDFVGTWPGRGLLLASVPVGAAAGGFVASMVEGTTPRKMGWWVGSLSIISAIVFASVDRDFSDSGWIGWDTYPLWLVTVLCGAAGGEFWRRRQRDAVVDHLFGRNQYLDLPDEESLYQNLYIKTGHDPERVERLIEFERQFMPNATRRTLIEGAINRWERDNR